MKRGWIGRALLVAVILAVCAAPASSQRMTGEFWVALAGNSDEANWNILVPTASGGTGWNGNLQGPWFRYPRFWNQWYFDGIYDPTRFKIVDIAFTYSRLDVGLAGYVEIWINWSTPQWSTTPGHADGPPLSESGPNNEPYLGRAMLEVFPIGENQSYDYSLTGHRISEIPYNPEWVSIDVRGYNTMIWNGRLVHECVPEPGSVLALLFGLISLGGVIHRRSR